MQQKIILTISCVSCFLRSLDEKYVYSNTESVRRTLRRSDADLALTPDDWQRG